MGSIEKQEQGFTFVEVLLVILIMAVIGLGGYYVWQNQHKNTRSTAAATTIKKTGLAKASTAADPYADWKSYCSTYGGLCIKYPSDWKFNKQTFAPGESAAGQEGDSITSPTGNIIVKYTPHNEIGGTGANETMSTIQVASNSTSDLSVVSLVDTLNNTGSGGLSYTLENFTANNSKNQGSEVFVAGKNLTNSYEPRIRQFQPTNRPGFNSILDVEYNQNDKSDSTGLYATYDAALAMLNSSEGQTANKILRSASYAK